jgi:hypothetical protein
MKKQLFLAIAISMGMLVGCGDSSSDSPTSPTNPITKDDNGTDVGSVSAFFPAELNASDVVAWYATDVETESREGVSLAYLSAVYLFNDGSFIVTESQWRDSKGYHKGVVAEGGWSSGGSDYSNGIIEITMNGNKLPLEIKNGKFSINPDGEGEMHYTLMKSDVPKSSSGGSGVEDNSKVVEQSRNGTEEQLEKAKLLIQGSGAEAAEGIAFEIAEPEWEQVGVVYKAVYTITVAWDDEKFAIDDSENAIGIGQYPVHAIGVQEESLPRDWNNNEWDLLNISRGENSVTVTISQKIDNLKIARAYVEGTYRGIVVTLYSKAFFIIPPGTEVEGYTSSPAPSGDVAGKDIEVPENKDDHLPETVDAPDDETIEVTPFFPTGYNAEDVVAWYATGLETLVESSQTKVMVIAVYLLKDGSYVVTESKVKYKTDRTVVEKELSATGAWSGSGEDYQNGSFEMTVEGMVMPIEIVDGSFVIEGEESPMAFSLMTSEVPEPSEPSKIEK